jgi:cytoskeleton protein RodZ
MPLDTARVTDELGMLPGMAPAVSERESGVDTYFPGLESGPTIGAALRTVREFHGLDLEDLAQATRIRRSYLIALEEMRLQDLPSRPFVIGYIRAYARVLRLDPEAAVAKFRNNAPEEDQGLRAPVGVPRERDPRLTLFVIAGVAVVIGVAAWNIVQHRVVTDAPKAVSTDVAQSAAKSAALPQPSGAPATVAVGTPLPAPPESTTPVPYITPGLESSTGAAAPQSSAAAAAPAPGGSETPTPFVAKGSVYGAPAGQSVVILQANHSGLLVIHGADGTVYFGKELAPGEAYRVPEIGGLSVDVSNPADFNYFVGGLLKGALPAAKAPVSSLTGSN